MTILSDEMDERIYASLAQSVPCCRRARRNRWEFGLAGADGVAGSAAMEDGWLLLRFPLHAEWDGVDDWSLLIRNAALEGLCKFVRDPFRFRRELHADLPLDSEEALELLPGRMRKTLEGFQSLLGRSRRRPKAVAADSTSAPAGRFSLAGLLQETGWPFIERSTVQFAVDLEVPGRFVQALVEDHGGGGVTVRVEAAKYDSLAPSQRSALAFFLLAAGGMVRMARSSLLESGASVVARLEVSLSAPGPTDLDHALSAVSVASDLCVREAGCLGREQVAEIYGTARCGLCIKGTKHPFNKHNHEGDGYGNHESTGIDA
jgi:hypothetical protein